MQLCLTKLSVILKIDPYVMSLDVFSMKASNFQVMSAKNDSLLQIEKLVIIYSSIWIKMNDGYFLFWPNI